MDSRQHFEFVAAVTKIDRSLVHKFEVISHYSIFILRCLHSFTSSAVKVNSQIFQLYRCFICFNSLKSFFAPLVNSSPIAVSRGMFGHAGFFRRTCSCPVLHNLCFTVMPLTFFSVDWCLQCTCTESQVGTAFPHPLT